MRTAIVAITAGLAILVLSKPAQALPSTVASHYGETNAGVVYIDHRGYWRGGHYRGYAYGYRPYYHPYYYPYYRPYAYYGYPYYYRRPGISLYFGF